jgi:small subunit ribosomal protein S20
LIFLNFFARIKEVFKGGKKMPNIKSAKKRVLITKKETVLNNDVKASMKTAIKNVEKAQTKEEAATLATTAIKRIDNAASKGVIKANTRDRYKTRVNKIVNSK